MRLQLIKVRGIEAGAELTYAEDEAHVLVVHVVGRVDVDHGDLFLYESQTRHFETKVCLSRA